MKREWIKLLAISVLLVGCGGGDSTSTASDTVAQTESASSSATATTPAYKAINNTGAGVEGKMGNYTVKLFTDSKEEVKPQERHQGVVVKYDGQTSETMAIQASYQGKDITAGIYDGDKLVKMSDSVNVSDVPVVIIDIK
jgi:nitrous oxide reductase accessory protein NosL